MLHDTFAGPATSIRFAPRSEEHTSELQSQFHLVCRLLLETYSEHRHLHSFPTRRSSDLCPASPQLIVETNSSSTGTSDRNTLRSSSSRSRSTTGSRP